MDENGVQSAATKPLLLAYRQCSVPTDNTAREKVAKVHPQLSECYNSECCKKEEFKENLSPGNPAAEAGPPSTSAVEAVAARGTSPAAGRSPAAASTGGTHLTAARASSMVDGLVLLLQPPQQPSPLPPLPSLTSTPTPVYANRSNASPVVAAVAGSSGNAVFAPKRPQHQNAAQDPKRARLASTPGGGGGESVATATVLAADHIPFCGKAAGAAAPMPACTVIDTGNGAGIGIGTGTTTAAAPRRVADQPAANIAVRRQGDGGGSGGPPASSSDFAFFTPSAAMAAAAAVAGSGGVVVVLDESLANTRDLGRLQQLVTSLQCASNDRAAASAFATPTPSPPPRARIIASYSLLQKLRAAFPQQYGGSKDDLPVIASAPLLALNDVLAPAASMSAVPAAAAAAAASADRRFQSAKAAYARFYDDLQRRGCTSGPAALGPSVVPLASSLYLARREAEAALPVQAHVGSTGPAGARSSWQLPATARIVVVDELDGFAGAAAGSRNGSAGCGALVPVESLPAHPVTGEAPGPTKKRWTTVVTLAQAVRAAGPAVARHGGQRVVAALRGLAAQAAVRQCLRVVAAPGAAERNELRLWCEVLGADE